MPYLEYFFIFAIGICVGSFCNVLIYRMPKSLSIVLPSSFCPSCKHRIKLYHNIPLLSFIFLKAKCFNCGEKIPFSYFFLEFFIGILAIALYYINAMSLDFLLLFLIFSLLTSLAVIDLKYKSIPESLAIFSLILALIYTVYHGNYFDSFVLMGFFYFMRLLVSFYMKQEAMGEGDIIIAGIIGAVMGIELSVYAVFVACVFAIPFALYSRSKGEPETPFVPFLAFGLITLYFYNNLEVLI